MKLFRELRGKVCTLFSADDDDLRWTGVLLGLDKEFFKIKALEDGRILYISKWVIDIVIEGDEMPQSGILDGLVETGLKRSPQRDVEVCLARFRNCATILLGIGNLHVDAKREIQVEEPRGPGYHATCRDGTTRSSDEPPQWKGSKGVVLSRLNQGSTARDESMIRAKPYEIPMERINGHLA